MYINIYYLRYGEVYWTMMDPVPLDPDLVARFKDKTMAIVGYESDQGQNLVFFLAFMHSDCEPCTDRNNFEDSYQLVKHFPDFKLWEYRIASFN